MSAIFSAAEMGNSDILVKIFYVFVGKFDFFFVRFTAMNSGDVAPQKHECFDGFVQCGEFCNRKQVKTSALLHSLGYVHFVHGFDKEAYDIITDTFCLMQCKIPFTNQLYKVFMQLQN